MNGPTVYSAAGPPRDAHLRLPAEYEMLFAAARPPGSPPDPEHSPSHIRWDVVARLADWHRLGPMLYRHLPHDVMPSQLVDRLAQAYLENVARNLYLRAQAAVVLETLAAAGLRAMPLKGMALIDGVYTDPGLRPMRDIDILVPHGEVDRAQKAVTALGYRALPPVHGEEGGEGWMAEHHHHLPALVSEDGRFAVEIHHHLVGPRDPAHFDIAGFWDRARPADDGPARLVPATEDLLAHVALHFCRNRMWRSEGALGQAADVAWIVDRCGPDWDALVRRAWDDGLAPSLFLALLTARDLLGAAVPTDVMVTLQPSAFTPDHGRRFLRSRVLRSHSWLPLEYLTKKGPPMQRAVPDRQYLVARYGGNGGTPLSRMLLSRAVNGFRAFGPSLARPWARVGDVRLNHWMRSLDRSG